MKEKEAVRPSTASEQNEPIEIRGLKGKRGKDNGLGQDGGTENEMEGDQRLREALSEERHKEWRGKEVTEEDRKAIGGEEMSEEEGTEVSVVPPDSGCQEDMGEEGVQKTGKKW